jgi:predicted Fe-S protein YdhL (DUF1289 family)
MDDSDASPCIRNCTLDDEDVCIGCGRTIDEIIEWMNASPERKREIRALLPQRLRARERRRGS